MTRVLRRQRGMTIAELMVAATVGLAVLLAAGALLVSANAAYLAQVDAAAMDDGGRYALEIIGRSLRQAAFVDWERIDPAVGIDPAAPAHLDGLDARSIARTSDAIKDPLPDAVHGSDVLAVRFAGAGPAPDGDGSVTSCAGFPVSELEEGWSIFYVARNATGEAELRCKYRGASSWGADAVVAGVDSFQVLYGLDTDTPPDGVANRYVNADALAALDAALVLAGATPEERELDRLSRTHWKRIVSVKAALLLHGAKAAPNVEQGTYDLFGPAYGEAFGDLDPGTRLREVQLAAERGQRARRLFAATFVMRSRPK